MKATLQIANQNFKGSQEVINRCLNRIMEVRVLEINLKEQIIAVDYAKPSVYERIKNELNSLGLAVGELKPLK